MVRKFGEKDWTKLRDSSRPMGMVTLTYPGDWLAVCPSGRVAKRHLAALRLRFWRATGERLDGAWKLEFQKPRPELLAGGAANPSAGQEAPHFHLLMPCPAMVKGARFETWLSRTWASIVGAVGDERTRHEAAGTRVDLASAARMTDPKRLGIYFLKHGTKTLDGKEYQHNVPQAWLCDVDGVFDPEVGPGRFWGFWGMADAVQAVELDAEDYYTVRRELRKLDRARSYRIARDRRYWQLIRDGWSAGEATRIAALSTRSKRRRFMGAGGQLSGGFLMVESGSVIAANLARLLADRR